MISTNKMFKTISSDELSKLKISIDRKYYYFSETDVKEIKEQKFENSSNEKMFQLVDDDYEWNPKINSLFMDLNLSLKNCSCIFGKNGTCYKDAIIGIGLSWKPDKSRIKRCIKIGEITTNDNEKNFTINSIELQNISSNVSFKLFMYVVKPGTIDGNPFFGNEQGIVIHDENAWTIIVDGGGSVFPIIETEEENGPLWYFKCDVSDICEENFDDDHILIVLNKKHPLYPSIHPKSPEYNDFFQSEVLSSAITCIVMAIRNKQPNGKIDFDQEYESGSILQVLSYFKEKLGFNINGSYQELISSIKMFFDKEC